MSSSFIETNSGQIYPLKAPGPWQSLMDFWNTNNSYNTTLNHAWGDPPLPTDTIRVRDIRLAWEEKYEL